MGVTYSTDLRHFLDPEGRIAPTGGPGRQFAQFLTELVASATLPTAPVRSVVPCQVRPPWHGCPGLIEFAIEPRTQVVAWHCDTCETSGVIHHWQGSFWDCRATSPT